MSVGSASSANRIAASVSPLAAVCCERNDERERLIAQRLVSRLERFGLSGPRLRLRSCLRLRAAGLAGVLLGPLGLPDCLLLTPEPDDRAGSRSDRQQQARCRRRSACVARAASPPRPPGSGAPPRAPVARAWPLPRPRCARARLAAPSPPPPSAPVTTPRRIRRFDRRLPPVSTAAVPRPRRVAFRAAAEVPGSCCPNASGARPPGPARASQETPGSR